MPEIHDSKYVVFKKDEWYTFVHNMEFIDIRTASRIIPVPIDDAVVIRRQDKFAPPALDAYSNAIMTTVEGMDELSQLIDPEHEPASWVERFAKLRAIADYFHLQATESWHTKRKLPD